MNEREDKDREKNGVALRGKTEIYRVFLASTNAGIIHSVGRLFGISTVRKQTGGIYGRLLRDQRWLSVEFIFGIKALSVIYYESLYMMFRAFKANLIQSFFCLSDVYRYCSTMRLIFWGDVEGTNLIHIHIEYLTGGNKDNKLINVFIEHSWKHIH